jgi:hypothetical protein
MVDRQRNISNERGQTQAEFGIVTLILAILVIAILFLIGPAFASM